MPDNPIRRHGIVRGLENVASSPQFEGRFGRMFRTLPAAQFDIDKDLKPLAGAMVAGPDPITPETKHDDEENTGIKAGYTYLGQFIDHDLTFDPNSSLDKQNDPDSLVDFRTPRFDLDSIYGRGPDDQPYLYEDGGLRMQLGRRLTANSFDANPRDVQRNAPESGPKRALIGDPRNDENVIVSQLQAAFLRFHNRVVDYKGTETPFAKIQQIVRWHYQWVVLHDFLPTILGNDTLGKILPHLAKKTTIHDDKPDLRFYHCEKNPFIPVEFSVAAYRFGHSMVRPIYRLNSTLERLPIFFSADPTAPSLVGFREFPESYAIDWRLFFDFGNNPPELGPERIQPAYKIDSSLVNPLKTLPPSIASKRPSLAERNLVRGLRMGLPSGQAVAKKMGLPVILDENLKVGKATEDGVTENVLLTKVSPRFAGNAPLWYYILAEAQQQFENNETPIQLGPVGGRIVGEVFVGLLLGDKHSFLHQDPCWTPIGAFTREGQKGGTFGMAELLTQAMKA